MVALETSTTTSTLHLATHTAMKQLTAANLRPSEVDHGYSYDDFKVGHSVMAYFDVGPIAGTISAANKRRRACSILLDHPLCREFVVVSYRSIKPLEEVDDDDTGRLEEVQLPMMKEVAKDNWTLMHLRYHYRMHPHDHPMFPLSCVPAVVANYVHNSQRSFPSSMKLSFLTLLTRLKRTGSKLNASTKYLRQHLSFIVIQSIKCMVYRRALSPI